MSHLLESIKLPLDRSIALFLDSKREQQENENFKRYLEYIKEFTLRGKQVRGSLFLYALLEKQDLDSSPFKEHWLKAGVAIELIQSSFLIHDDIMDRSNTRRSFPSMHKMIEADLHNRFGESKEHSHHGVSLAIVLGDYLIFLAQELLAELVEGHDHCKLMMDFVQKEWQNVCLYQMEDILLGLEHFSNPHLQDRILKLYEGKTARYTFSVPLVLSSMILEPKDAIDPKMIELGVNIGVLFQIHDDFLDLLHTDKGTDKAIGTDIKEQKKTLCLYLLYQSIVEKDQKVFNEVLLKETISKEDLNNIKNQFKEYHILEQIASIQQGYYERSLRLLEEIKMSDRLRELLMTLIKKYSTQLAS